MALEKDFELLDDYLANRLSAEEKASFEKQIGADPELKREFVTQQKLIEGIKQARLTELKGILNKIPVTPLPASQALFTKLGIFAVAAGLIGTGIYFFLLKGDTEVKLQPEIAKQEVPAVQKETKPAEEPKEDPALTEPEVPAVTEKTAPKKSNKKASKPAVQSTPEQKEEEVATPPKPEAYDPSKEETSDSVANYNKILLGSAIRSMNSSGLVVDNIPDNRKYDFHYQFNDGKLTLYGQKFRDSSMYQILEFFGNNQIPTTVVLYQSNKYYLIKEGNKEITKLTAITDPALLNKLDKYRRSK